MNDPTRVWTTGCRRRCILRGNIERILSAWGAPFPPLMVYEGVQRRRFPAEKKTGVTVGLLRPGRHRSPKPTRFKRLKSTLFLLMGRPEERSESATRGTWICVWDKPRHRSKLQRATNPLEKRPIRQNTLNFSFRGLDNGVNYKGCLLPIDLDHVAALIAPRPFLDLRAAEDPYFPNRREIDQSATSIEAVYQLHGAADRFKTCWFPGGHAHGPAAARESQAWFYRWLWSAG